MMVMTMLKRGGDIAVLGLLCALLLHPSSRTDVLGWGLEVTAVAAFSIHHRSYQWKSAYSRNRPRPDTVASRIITQFLQQEPTDDTNPPSDELTSQPVTPEPALSTDLPVRATSLESSSPKISVRPLDPLVARLTSMDDTTRNAPTIQIPVWGDLIMDQSLFVFIPVASFAIVGIVLSLYILLNSGDAFVQAINDAASTASSLTPSSTETTTGTSCRGLCGSQQEDLAGMKAWMNSISGK